MSLEQKLKTQPLNWSENAASPWITSWHRTGAREPIISSDPSSSLHRRKGSFPWGKALLVFLLFSEHEWAIAGRRNWKIRERGRGLRVGNIGCNSSNNQGRVVTETAWAADIWTSEKKTLWQRNEVRTSVHQGKGKREYAYLQSTSLIKRKSQRLWNF